MKITLPRKTEILNIVTIDTMTKIFTFEYRFEYEAGQYIMVWIPSFDEKPFVLLSSNSIQIKRVGPFTELLHRKECGEFMWVRGAFGNNVTSKDFYVRCGVGLCGSCEYDGKLLCVE